MTPALRISDLSYSYPDGYTALSGVDLEVETGQRVALLGPNGAGKTTLALQLNGVKEPDSGTVTVGDLTLSEATLGEIRRRVGLVFQDANDQLFMPTVGEDVAFGPANLDLKGEELHARVAEALLAVGATELEHRAPHHLSGGERRRIAIAGVLAMRPDMLVLDEPNSGLDPAGRRELISLLQGLPITQIVITHDLPLALELCDRAIIMDAGQLVAEGPTAEILQDTELLHQHRLELPFGFDPSVIHRKP